MFLRKGIWQYDFIRNGKRYRGSLGFKEHEKAKAVAALRKIMVNAEERSSIEHIWEQTKRQLASFNEIPLMPEDISKAFDMVGGDHACKLRRKCYTAWLRDFCNWMHTNAPEARTMDKVRESHAQAWFAALRAAPGAPVTKNDKLGYIKRLFGRIGKNGGIIDNPFDGIKPLAKEQESREAFSPEELKLIGEKATGWVYSICLTALSTGLRRGDICKLKKTDIDLIGGWITVRTSKTKSTVDIPIMPGLRKHIEEKFRECPDSEWVFPELAYMYEHNPTAISQGCKEFFESIGIQDVSDTPEGYQKKVSKKDIHSFRHTFVYLAAVSGIPFPIVQSIVGHANASMTKHYMDHARREEKIRYFSQLPDYITGGVALEKKQARAISLLQSLSPDELAAAADYLETRLRR